MLEYLVTNPRHCLKSPELLLPRYVGSSQFPLYSHTSHGTTNSNIIILLRSTDLGIFKTRNIRPVYNSVKYMLNSIDLVAVDPEYPLLWRPVAHAVALLDGKLVGIHYRVTNR